ncbi:RNI-like protein [Rozella allomycis CSF55]|uniref:RNI-like protein n=1 Tax=Rozella allomycis (strain CSF55) TaxID=988480 RepID=A0A4P9YGP5_ROZAC|nr:RNI-like protein [Rozella allomycis CSF55]
MLETLPTEMLNEIVQYLETSDVENLVRTSPDVKNSLVMHEFKPKELREWKDLGKLGITNRKIVYGKPVVFSFESPGSLIEFQNLIPRHVLYSKNCVIRFLFKSRIVNFREYKRRFKGIEKIDEIEIRDVRRGHDLERILELITSLPLIYSKFQVSDVRVNWNNRMIDSLIKVMQSRQLKELIFLNNNFGPKIERIIDELKNSQVKYFSLEMENEMEYEKPIQLNHNLKRLKLVDNAYMIHAAEMRELIKSNLEYLELDEFIYRDGLEALLEHLPQSKIQTLKLTNNGLEEFKGLIKKLIKATKSLKSLTLERFYINDEDLEFLGSNLKDSNLISINLQGNQFTDVGAANFVSHLIHSNLINLDLSFCFFHSTTLAHIFQGLSNSKLQNLNLRGLRISNQSFSNLLAIISTTKIKRLDLSENKISGISENRFENCTSSNNSNTSLNDSITISTQTLEYLNLNFNDFKSVGLIQFMKFLLDNRLDINYLDISYNYIDDKSIDEIINWINQSKRLNKIDLSFNSLTENGLIILLQNIYCKSIEINLIGNSYFDLKLSNILNNRNCLALKVNL